MSQGASPATRTKRYCLVTSGHITNNPRVVKEADALAAAGIGVRVVSLATLPGFADADHELARAHGWPLTLVDGVRAGTHHRRWLRRSIVERAALRAFQSGVSASVVADRAVSRMLPDLARAAAAQPADAVVAHNLAALPAAGRAAAKLEARLGFDSEDLHSEEMRAGKDADARRTLVTAVEAHWLPSCDYVTASSPGIASQLAERYDIARPHVVLNTFPRALRDRRISVRDRERSTPTVYWYSQTIGADRGIDEALLALAGLPFPVDLHLRGTPEPAYLQHLQSLAREKGMSDRLYIHPPAPADDMVALARQHDIGLAAEQPVCLNRELCATNKLFTYLLAGNAIAATDTAGQRDILARCPEAAILYRPGAVEELRAGIWSLLASPARLAKAKSAALDAALTRFSWEHEAPGLVAYLTGARGGPRVRGVRGA